MLLIEPCCAQKNLLALRQKLGADGTCFFHGYGDLSLAELLPVLLTRYSQAELMIVTPSLPDGAAEVIDRMMKRQWAAMKGGGKIDNIGHLQLLTDLTKKKSPLASAWRKENPYGDRLSLHAVQQNDTAIILPDIAIVGGVNLVYGGHFTALATKNKNVIASFRNIYEALLR